MRRITLLWLVSILLAVTQAFGQTNVITFDGIAQPVFGTGTFTVDCVSGCAGGTADTDDGSIAGGQSVSLSGALSNVWNGAAWIRLTLGQTTMSASVPVTIASDQAAVPASQSGVWTIRAFDQNGVGINSTGNALWTFPKNTAVADASAVRCVNAAGSAFVECGVGGAGATDTDDGSIAGGQVAGLSASLGYVWNGTAWVRLTQGQATMAASVPVVLPSDQTVAVSGPLTDAQLRATAVPVSGPLTDTQLRATPVPVSGTVTANQGTANTAANRWPTYVTDGTNTMPTMDAAARRGFVQVSDGTNNVTATGTSLNVNCTGGCGAAAQQATYSVTLANTPTGGKDHLTIFNGSGSGKILYVHKISVAMQATAAVTGGGPFWFNVNKVSDSGSGGCLTPTIQKFDSADATLPAQVVASGNCTTDPTSTFIGWLTNCQVATTEETAITDTRAALAHTPCYQFTGNGLKPITLREGEGISLDQGPLSAVTAGNIVSYFEFASN